MQNEWDWAFVVQLVNGPARVPASLRSQVSTLPLRQPGFVRQVSLVGLPVPEKVPFLTEAASSLATLSSQFPPLHVPLVTLVAAATPLAVGSLVVLILVVFGCWPGRLGYVRDLVIGRLLVSILLPFAAYFGGSIKFRLKASKLPAGLVSSETVFQEPNFLGQLLNELQVLGELLPPQLILELWVLAAESLIQAVLKQLALHSVPVHFLLDSRLLLCELLLHLAQLRPMLLPHLLFLALEVKDLLLH